jgi:hypothetical protein
VSNEKYTDTEISAPYALALPSQAETDRGEKTAEIPPVPTTADLPMLPEFRTRARVINWRAAITSAGLGAFLAGIAGVGCGTATNDMLKPSPATPAALNKGMSRSLRAISSASPFGVAGSQKPQPIPAKTAPTPNPFLVGPTTTLNAPACCNFGPVVN